jgi:hypothetical protein
MKNKMKKNIIIVTLLFCSFELFAQAKLETKKIFSGKFAEEKSTFNNYEDCIPYNNELLLVNYDASLAYRFYYFLIAPQAVLNSYSIDRVDPISKKIKTLPILQDFQGLDVTYYTYLIKGDILKTFFGYYNKKKKTQYIFCSEIDLKTNKSKTSKIYENKQKGGGIKTSYMNIIPNREENTIALIDLNNTGKVTFDYVIKDFDMNIIDYGEKISAAENKDANITHFTLTKHGEIIFNSIKQTKRVGLFRSAEYSDKVYIIKDKKIKALNLNISKYFSNVKLIKNKDGDALILMNYSEVYGKNEGIYLAGIDAENGELINTNKITYADLQIANDKTTARAEARKNKKDKREAESSSNIITDVSIAPNGDIYLLQEIKKVVTRKTTSRNPNGTTTSRNPNGTTTTETQTYYYYGPGVVHCIDPKTNEHKGLVKLDYKFSSTVDMGQGLQYVPSNNKKIWVSNYGEYYTYELDNSSKPYHPGKGKESAIIYDLKNLFNGYKRLYTGIFGNQAKRKATNLFTFIDKAYSVSKTSKKLEIGEITLE